MEIDEFYSSLFTTQTAVGIVIGLGCTLVGHYLAKHLDGYLSKFSASRQEKNASKAEKHRRQVEHLKQSQQNQYQYQLDLIEYRLSTLWYLGQAVLLWVFAVSNQHYSPALSSIMVILGTAVFCASMYRYVAYLSAGRALREARERQDH